MTKPNNRPRMPFFSSGPCAKRPGWTPSVLANALVGRSHRSGPAKARLKDVIGRTRTLLGIPDDYRIGIVPASDTGAMEMAMWTLLGPRGVDVLVWESFGKGWATDIEKQLRLPDIRVMSAGYGALPDLSQVDSQRDLVFTWNGTTSGVRVPDGTWIAADRAGLTICDATSAAFAQALPWDRLDVTTFSWQKVLGGEAQHGILILSPRAVERLLSHTPSWPLPKIFRLTKGGKLIESVFVGETINTPSMLAVEDMVDALGWAESIGGLPALQARADANLSVLGRWVESTPWVTFLAEDPATISNTSVCLKITADWFDALDAAGQKAAVKEMVSLLEKEAVAYDINGYRDAPAGLRIWAGATVENTDLTALVPWLTWAYEQVMAKHASATG